MKRFILGILSLFFFTCCQGRQTPDKKSTPDDKSLLWKISGKNLSRPSFLFGTIHMICKSDFLWTEAMKNSLKESEEVCMEMDMDDPALAMQVAAGMMDLSGKKLKDYFTPEQYAVIEQYAQDSLGMDLELFQMMKPVVLLPLFTTGSSGCDSPMSYEMKIMEDAKEQEKEVTGLETAQEQMDVMNSIPTDSLVAELVEMTQGKAQDDKMYNRLVAAYKAQDLPVLYTAMKESGGLSGEWNAFLDDRNKRWISRMENKMKKQRVFFAVGAGHLYGEVGVISLLRKAGYTVEAVR